MTLMLEPVVVAGAVALVAAAGAATREGAPLHAFALAGAMAVVNAVVRISPGPLAVLGRSHEHQLFQRGR